MITNPTNLRDVGDTVAATLGRPLTDEETQELSRALAALGVRQNPAFSQIVGVLMTMRWKLETAGKGIVAAAASAERTAVAHRDAAVAEAGREIGKALDVRAITAKIVAAAVAASLLTAVVSAGVSWYFLQRAGIDATAARNDLRRIAAESASAALWATAGGKTDDPEVVDAWEKISPRLAGLIADVPREKRANYIKNLDELTKRLTISSENGADKEDPSHTLSAVMVIAGIPQRNAQQIAKIAAEPYFSCAAAPALDTKSSR